MDTSLVFIIPDLRQFAHVFFAFWQKAQTIVLLLYSFHEEYAAFFPHYANRRQKKAGHPVTGCPALKRTIDRPQAGLPDNRLLDVLTGVIAEYADMMAYLQSWNYDYTYGEEGNQSDTVQKCLRDAERQTDEQIRLSTLYKAEKALMEDVPMIPLQLRKESLLLNRNLTGFETSMNLAGGGYEFLYADFK